MLSVIVVIKTDKEKENLFSLIFLYAFPFLPSFLFLSFFPSFLPVNLQIPIAVLPLQPIELCAEIWDFVPIF